MAFKKTFFGRKLGMTQIFSEEGLCVPVTIIDAPPISVVDVKTQDRDGYVAVKVAFDEQKEHRMTKPKLGLFKKAGVTPKRTIREIRVDDAGEVKAGDELKLDRLKDVGFVDVMGVTKGRGFTGVVKRWGFHGQPASHGTTEGERAPGSLGRQHGISQGVYPGKKMAGHSGHAKRTIKNLEVIKLDEAKHLLFVRGAIPGPNGGLVRIREAYRKRPAARAKEEVPLRKKKVL